MLRLHQLINNTFNQSQKIILIHIIQRNSCFFFQYMHLEYRNSVVYVTGGLRGVYVCVCGRVVAFGSQDLTKRIAPTNFILGSFNS